ncbi:type IV secretion protein Rhs [Flavobacterium crocinum]|uniref:Type IV secretion protein Rhs n=1 Tax=Flavobacterium crocinum TaxID=2183896 RepID=A0A2S1YSY2_9FLAO|nr:phage baseplate assembly protein V [Flavobacterium crocinum]AWK07112.1 type IV secretion protein Rhs [Flavobacterium crocinum]
MSKFSEQVHISISTFKKNIVYYDLKLTQSMANHHYFSFVWQYTAEAVIDPEKQANAVSKYIGSEVIFTFKVNGIKLMSKGIVRGLKSIDRHGSPAGLHVYGISHTVFLEDGPKSRIFLDKNLQQIALEIFAETQSDEFYQTQAIRPTYTKSFSFKPQYNETSFNFIKRLSERYGQWFYFDGMRMQFGETKATNIKLINGSSLHEFTIETNLFSHKSSFGSYDYLTASNIRNSALVNDNGSRDRFTSSMVWNQLAVTTKELNVGTYTNNAQNKEEIDEMVKLQTSAHNANCVFYSGISYFPIGVGQVFSIQNKTVEHSLIAVEVIHHSQVNGDYKCEFKAIPSDVVVPHYTNVNVFAFAEAQPAKITDNNDPEGLGRVKVQYYWNGWGNESEWMRVTQLYAGSGKGGYFRPEIGEEVQVSFQGGNAECPYVSGTYYNGKEKPEFFDPKNMIKGWKLRFGMLFKFIEKVGIWLSDPSGNELHMNEETKSTTITVPETLTLNCKNLIINASESITTNAGMNISETATINKSTNVGGMLNTNVIGNSMFYVRGNHDEFIDGDLNSDIKKDKNYTVAGKNRHQSENGHEFHSDTTIKNNSSEDTTQN